MMRNLEHEGIERDVGHWLDNYAQSLLSLWSIGEWFSRMIGRSCDAGMWTISRDGKLVCESLVCGSCQPE
jgi:hypothetical protein